MKNQIKNFLIIGTLAILGILVFLLITQSKKIEDLKTKNKYLSNTTDTVYIEKPLKVGPEYVYIEKPKYITKYLESEPKEIKEIQIIHDTVRVYTDKFTSFDISSEFLTRYPNTDRLIQLLFTDDNLQLSLLDVKGNVFSKTYDINTELYSYNYVNNQLSWKRKPFIKRFSPTLGITYRPINSMYDLSLGLKYNTRKINYEVGLNSFYYPKFKSELGLDVYLRISYNF